MATLFGGGGSRCVRLRPRWRALTKIFSRHDIICLQETHGHEGDLTTLDDRFPEFCHFGSFCRNWAAGGVTISIKRSLVEGRNVTFEQVLQGRCVIVRVASDDLILNVVNVHVEPSLCFAGKSALLNNIVRRSRISLETFIYAGDWNFVELGDDRLELSDLT
jgi:exonuclease III